MTIEPQGAVPLCMGDKREFVCTVEGIFAEWTVSQDGPNIPYNFMRIVQNTVQMSSTMIVNYTTFNFSRISVLNSLPLVTSLIISNVTSDLNGTMVTCRDRITQDSSSALLQVHIGDKGILQGR